jgi:hypothetical protein
MEMGGCEDVKNGGGGGESITVLHVWQWSKFPFWILDSLIMCLRINLPPTRMGCVKTTLWRAALSASLVQLEPVPYVIIYLVTNNMCLYTTNPGTQ